MIRPSAHIVYRDDLEEGGVILNTESGRAFRVNPTGVRIWNLLQQGLDKEQVLHNLKETLTDTPSTLEQDIKEFLEHLHAHGLVERVDGA